MENLITKEEVDKLMTQRGYKFLSHNTTKEVITKVNYFKTFSIKNSQQITLHATVNLTKATKEISFKDMNRGCKIVIPTIDVECKDFEEFEQVLLIYAANCLQTDPIEILNNWLETVPKREKDSEIAWGEDASTKVIAPEAITAPPAPSTPQESKATKKTIKERKRAFWDALTPIAKQRGWDKSKTLKFYEYWTEENKSGTKFRRETENFFDINKRMATFDRIDNERVNNRKSFADQKAEKQNDGLYKTKELIKAKDVF